MDGFPRVAVGGQVGRTEGSMGDLIYIGLALGFFGLSWAFVVLCERL